jgi:polyisoprenoid-binding protein YceI
MTCKNRFFTATDLLWAWGTKYRSSSIKFHAGVWLALCAASLGWTATASAQERAIDTRQSMITIRVHKSGLFSGFGHDHEIAAPITNGTVNMAARQVELHLTASSLRVRDRDAGDKDRNEIQNTMLGPKVLDVVQYPEILFRSPGSDPAGADSWQVHGNLTLHGQVRPVVVEVKERGSHYVGASSLKQTDFGITPIKIAGGTVQVKNEIEIEFDIQLAR